MAIFGANEYEIEQKITSTQVRDNDIAKCMYYVACVCNTIECNEGQIRRYTDYKNYWKLSSSEHEIVFKLCLTLSPDEFDDKVFFESDAMCGDSSNEFYEIGQVRHVLMAVRSVVVAGRTRQVNKIMTYKRSWLVNNYLGPMSRLADRFNPQRQLMRAMQEADCVIS